MTTAAGPGRRAGKGEAIRPLGYRYGDWRELQRGAESRYAADAPPARRASARARRGAPSAGAPQRARRGRAPHVEGDRTAGGSHGEERRPGPDGAAGPG